MFTGSVVLSGSSFSQITCGVGKPSTTPQDSLTLPPASVSPSQRHTGSDGGAAHTHTQRERVIKPDLQVVYKLERVKLV